MNIYIYILQELKDHIGRTLAKEKNIGETVAFTVDERASLTDVRRRTNGIVRNAKAYKVPQKVLGSVLCNLIEHGKYVPVIALPVCQRSILKPTCYCYWFQ